MNRALYSLVVVIPLLLSFVLLPGCECNNSNEIRKGLDELNDREAQWNGNQLANYTLSYTRWCFCQIMTIKIEYVNGAITSIGEYEPNGGSLVRTVPEQEYSNYHNITKFFALIREYDKSVDELLVQYDSSLGYPSSISVDPMAEHWDCTGSCSNSVDDEFTYIIAITVNG